MDFDLFKNQVLSIVVLVLLLIGSSVLIINYAIETFKQRVNSLRIFCSEAPIVGSTEIQVFETTIYCQLSET